MNDEDFAMRKRGFTLIEMLIVVAIVAILAALLMPALRHGLDAAKSAACANNEKQLFTCFTMFADDNHGCYPPGNTKYTGGKDQIDWPYFSSGSESTWDGRWINCLGPYFGKDDWIYKKSGWGVDMHGTPAMCPSAPHPSNTDGLSYGLNVCLSKRFYRTNNYNTCNSQMTKVSQIPRPGISVMLVDTLGVATVGPDRPTEWHYVHGKEWLGATTPPKPRTSDFIGPHICRHLEGCNVLFADGRLKWVDWATMVERITDTNNSEYGAWRLP